VGKHHSHLSLEERELISIMLAKEKSYREIGKVLGRHHTTISRELQTNSPPVNKGYYLGNRAHRRALNRRSNSHKRERLKNDTIRGYVKDKLMLGWSPEQIAGRISLDRGGTKISYEAIYQYVYREAEQLIRYLPRHHRKRSHLGHSGKHLKSHIPERVSIDERPKHIEYRKEIGHWEADTAGSRKSLAALQVLTERKSRNVCLTKLNRKTSSKMSKAVIRRLKQLPKYARNTITFDNGPENVGHNEITKAIGVKAYFCAPFRSWEKGTVENSVGLVRRFFPKSTDFNRISYYEISKVENLLNNRPRKCLNYATPNEVLSGAIAG